MKKLELDKVVERFDELFEKCNQENGGKGVSLMQITETIWGGVPHADGMGAYIDLINDAPQVEEYITKEGMTPYFNKDMCMLLTLFHCNGHKVGPLSKYLPPSKD